MTPHADDLFAVGVTDMRATVMPQRFEEALEFVSPYLERRGTAPSARRTSNWSACAPQVTRWCAAAANAPGSPSLDHNDLHPWNVFADNGPDGMRARFYDWGDAVVAHPFASMLVGLRVPSSCSHWPRTTAVAAGPRRLPGAVRRSREPRADLVETLELACRVGQIARALVWARAVGELGVDAPDSYQTAPMAWLAGLLGPSYLGPS